MRCTLLRDLPNLTIDLLSVVLFTKVLKATKKFLKVLMSEKSNYILYKPAWKQFWFPRFPTQSAAKCSWQFCWRKQLIFCAIFSSPRSCQLKWLRPLLPIQLEFWNKKVEYYFFFLKNFCLCMTFKVSSKRKFNAFYLFA